MDVFPKNTFYKHLSRYNIKSYVAQSSSFTPSPLGNVVFQGCNKVLAFNNIEEGNVYGVDLPGNDGKAGMAALVANSDINLKDLYSHLKNSLPSYAMPIILRIKKESLNK